MTNDPDVLGIIIRKYTDPNGTRMHYRARGLGATYNRFYDWLNTRSLGRQWDDWPWHGWEFVNSTDETEILRLWSQHFLSPDPDEVSDEIEPVPEPPSEDDLWIGLIFQEEITKELNAQILAEIGFLGKQ